MKIFFLSFGVLLLSFLAPTMVQAQNTNSQDISSMNFSSIHVDDLSDQQIRQFMLKVQKTGLGENKLDQIALAKGLPPSELQKLKARIAKLKVEDAQKLESKGMSSNGLDTTQIPPGFGAANDSMSSKITRMEDALKALQPKIFGAELFNNPNMTFQPDLSIPTPQNYQIGPEDQIVIDVYGYSEANYNLTVSKEGAVNIPYIGLVYINGLTIQEATRKIKTKLADVYSGIKTGKTSVAVNIGKIRSIKVTLMGAITRPGTYTLPSLATVFNALYASGGPNENGSFRDIQLIRDNKVVAHLDVYDFLMKGDQSKNVHLHDQDVIRIPTYNDRVEITGEVKRPGLFEMKPGETMKDLLQYAGGFANGAYTAKIKAVRLTPTQKAVTDISASEFDTFHPQNGDKFSVSTILNRFTNRVIIDGAVYRPGPFELTSGLTLSQLIKEADGLKEDAFLPRGYIVRQNPDLTTSTLQFNLSKIMQGTASDIPLQREDVVHIYSIFDLRDQYTVSIKGEVRDSGVYQYSEGMTLEDLIMMAGGFTEGASPQRIEVSRRVTDTTNAGSALVHIAKIFQENVDKDLQLQASQFDLKPFDIVVVRSLPGFSTQRQVRIQGEVLYPGIYTLTTKNERISDLIKRAGGLTDLAYPQGASLKRTMNIDSSGLVRLKQQKFKQLQTNVEGDSAQLAELNAQLIHNDFVGIHLDQILKNPDSPSDLFLEEGDIINIPRRLQTVKVNGEVLFPVTTRFQPGRSMRYYISQAGGFSEDAKKGRVYVIYANGFVKSTSHFLFFKSYPNLEPGAEVFVPYKKPKNTSAREVLGVTSAVSSLALSVLAIMNLLKK